MAKRYPSDLTDAQWHLIKPLIPDEKPGGRDRTTDMREVINAILYASRAGCQWRMLPTEFPPKSTVYGYFSQWRDEGVWDDMVRVLREQVRVDAERNKQPSAAIIDSQSVKTTGATEDVGYDGGKKIKGRKRHIAVDVLGLLLVVVVHSAHIQDRAGAQLVVTALLHHFSTIKIMFADGGYTGHALMNWCLKVANIVLTIIKRPRKKFQIVKFRWIVERTFGWMNTQRRLSKDYECLPASAEAWVKIAAINTMICRLSPG
jgi:putative transposase